VLQFFFVLRSFSVKVSAANLNGVNGCWKLATGRPHKPLVPNSGPRRFHEFGGLACPLRAKTARCHAAADAEKKKAAETRGYDGPPWRHSGLAKSESRRYSSAYWTQSALIATHSVTKSAETRHMRTGIGTTSRAGWRRVLDGGDEISGWHGEVGGWR
jgi:hypothetical protein